MRRQKLAAVRDHWLSPPELVTSVPEVVPGFPDRPWPKDAAAAITADASSLPSTTSAASPKTLGSMRCTGPWTKL
jgi:hypothetical protein